MITNIDFSQKKYCNRYVESFNSPLKHRCKHVYGGYKYMETWLNTALQIVVNNNRIYTLFANGYLTLFSYCLAFIQYQGAQTMAFYRRNSH